jgi:hypothetical protein
MRRAESVQILSAQEGACREARASVNGDETDRGLQFHSDDPSVVRIVLGRF